MAEEPLEYVSPEQLGLPKLHYSLREKYPKPPPWVRNPDLRYGFRVFNHRREEFIKWLPFTPFPVHYFGRDPAISHFFVGHPSVAPQHAVAIWHIDSGKCGIMDNLSLTGTFVNNVLIDHEFKHINIGDRIRFGKSVNHFIFSALPPELIPRDLDMSLPPPNLDPDIRSEISAPPSNLPPPSGPPGLPPPPHGRSPDARSSERRNAPPPPHDGPSPSRFRQQGLPRPARPSMDYPDHRPMDIDNRRSFDAPPPPRRDFEHGPHDRRSDFRLPPGHAGPPHGHGGPPPGHGGPPPGHGGPPPDHGGPPDFHPRGPHDYGPPPHARGGPREPPHERNGPPPFGRGGGPPPYERDRGGGGRTFDDRGGGNRQFDDRGRGNRPFDDRGRGGGPGFNPRDRDGGRFNDGFQSGPPPPPHGGRARSPSRGRRHSGGHSPRDRGPPPGRGRGNGDRGRYHDDYRQY